MNYKEKLFHEIVETVARCCSYALKDVRQSNDIVSYMYSKEVVVYTTSFEFKE